MPGGTSFRSSVRLAASAKSFKTSAHGAYRKLKASFGPSFLLVSSVAAGTLPSAAVAVATRVPNDAETFAPSGGFSSTNSVRRMGVGATVGAPLGPRTLLGPRPGSPPPARSASRAAISTFISSLRTSQTFFCSAVRTSTDFASNSLTRFGISSREAKLRMAVNMSIRN